MRYSEKSQSLRMESARSGQEKMLRQASSNTWQHGLRTRGCILLCSVIFVVGVSAPVRAQQGMSERAGPRDHRRGQPEARARQPMKWQEQVGVFLSLTQERHRLEQRKEQLLNRLFDAKKRFGKERRPLRRFFLRKEIDQTEADLHLAIETSMAKKQEQRRLIRRFINNRKQIEDAITIRSEELERQTAALKQSPDANRLQLLRLQREQTRLSRIRELLAMMQADPERLVESPPTELPEPVPPLPDSPYGAMPLRFQQRLERLEKQLHFLQKRIDDCQKEIQEFQDLLVPYLPHEKMPTEPPPPPAPPEPTTTTSPSPVPSLL